MNEAERERFHIKNPKVARSGLVSQEKTVRQYSIGLDMEEIKYLKLLAKQCGRSLSYVVRHAVKYFIENTKGEDGDNYAMKKKDDKTDFY